MIALAKNLFGLVARVGEEVDVDVQESARGKSALFGDGCPRIPCRLGAARSSTDSEEDELGEVGKESRWFSSSSSSFCSISWLGGDGGREIGMDDEDDDDDEKDDEEEDEGQQVIDQ